MMKIKYLNSSRLYRALAAGGKAVIASQDYLNMINVFPVADADTGINLSMTMRAVLQGRTQSGSLSGSLRSMADSALSGARGNSGIIVAQYLHGLSREIPAKDELELTSFASAALKAVDHLYQSLMNPVEGTMLTVIRRWAESLKTASEKTGDYLQALLHAQDTARQALQETPHQLKVLKDAGVVDAGAYGIVRFLEGVVDYIQKGSLREHISETIAAIEMPAIEDHSGAPTTYRYCTEAILSSVKADIKELKSLIGNLGDSIILAGGPDKYHLHIHTNQPDLIFDKLFNLAEVSSPKVDDMLRQYQISHERKFPIGLVTDTACDLPQELADRYQIVQIPFGISFGDRFYLDKHTIQAKQFYRLLSSYHKHPVSSQPAPAMIQNLLEFTAMNYDKVIAVHISDKLSGAYQSSSLVASRLAPGKLGVINSRQLSVTEGLVTLRVARAIESGMEFDEIMLSSKEWADNTRIYTDINTLKYMVRGGRVPPLTGFVADLLNLKPIVSLDEEGKAQVYGKSLSRKRNMEKIIAFIAKDLQTRKIWEYAIVHAEAEDRAKSYAQKLTQLTGKKPAYIMPLSPVVGVHNGIGAVGIGVSYDPA
jgi:DegV family protein with EDD domain